MCIRDRYKLVSQPEIAKNPWNPQFWRSRSFKVIEFGGNREPVYDVLLVINSNLGPISHRYWDTATYWPKIAYFAHPLSFSALLRGDSLRIYGKALRFLKLKYFGLLKLFGGYSALLRTEPHMIYYSPGGSIDQQFPHYEIILALGNIYLSFCFANR